MRKFWNRVDAGIVVGLSLLAGCNQVPHRSLAERPAQISVSAATSETGTAASASATTASLAMTPETITPLLDDAPAAAGARSTTDGTPVPRPAPSKPPVATLGFEPLDDADTPPVVQSPRVAFRPAPPSRLPDAMVVRVAPQPPDSMPDNPVYELPKDEDTEERAPLLPPAGYDHAPDYSWLVGELQYLQTRGVWHLRFAPPGEPDRYGGTVTLTGDGMPSDCRSGQIVRVEGTVINPETHEFRPPYWVRNLKVLREPSEQ
jgi:hypothetical protein